MYAHSGKQIAHPAPYLIKKRLTLTCFFQGFRDCYGDCEYIVDTSSTGYAGGSAVHLHTGDQCLSGSPHSCRLLVGHPLETWK